MYTRSSRKLVISVRCGSPSGFKLGRNPLEIIATAHTMQMSTFTAGPAATMTNSARHRCGTSTYASPPSGQIRISRASPPTYRAPKQWPNSCSSTLTNSTTTVSRNLSSHHTLSYWASEICRRNRPMVMTKKKMWTRT